MIKTFSAIIISFIIFISCSKTGSVCNFNDSTIVAPSSEVTSIQNYLTANNLSATQSPSGFFYKINAQGSGTSIVNLCSNISVSYVGKFTNGTIFDQTPAGQPASFQLGSVIVGWQKALPLLNKGGTIRLYVPPSLAYGSTQQGPIPPNSILIFDITLVDIS